MSELKSIRAAELEIGNLKIKVHVLSDGQRVIEESSVVEFMKYMESGLLTEKEAHELAIKLKTF